MNHTIDANAFEGGWDFALSAMTGLCIGASCYGILLVLLGMAGYLLYHWNGSGRKILVAVTLAIAILATAQVALLIPAIILQLQLVRLEIEGEPWPLNAAETCNNIVFASDLLFVMNNGITDGLFIYRCFIVWGRDPRAPLLPALLLLCTLPVGCLAAYRNKSTDVPRYNTGIRVALAMGLATNVASMGLTAGRIWWIRRDACILESAHVKKYNSVITIILESGAMYLVANLLWLISSLVLPRDLSSASVPQLMNIIPMLTIVRVGLGRSLEDTTTTNERKGFSRARVAAPPQPSGLNMHVASSEVIYISAVHDYEAGMAIPMPDLRNEMSSE
ncbi:hypothetical protein DFH06DRAFT_1474658 [Mycena polygramma]|nr:hypothetical protein DFH06DRAFT_1474658 [Mycena polygramma]